MWKIGVASGVGSLSLLIWLVAAAGAERQTVSLLLPSIRVEAPAPAQQPDGKAIFEKKGNCVACHGKNAKGTPLGPDLTDGQWLNISGAPDEIAAVIRDGVARPKKYPAPMPPMGGARLSPEEVDAVARYVLGLNPAPTPRP